MKLWTVTTKICLIVETNWLFKKNKRTCYFKYGTKYVYAETEKEAIDKYEYLFFKSLNGVLNKKLLRKFLFNHDRCSNNMYFHLAVNQKIVNMTETIVTEYDEITDDIEEIKYKMTAQDFRDWFMNSKSKPSNLISLLQHYNTFDNTEE